MKWVVLQPLLIIGVTVAIIVLAALLPLYYSSVQQDEYKSRLFQFCEKKNIPLKDCKLPKKSYKVD